MPTKEEWKRFIANAPEAEREYRTLEVYHPQLDTVYRFVVNYCDVQLRLEDEAPRDGGKLVTFKGSTLKIIEPAERQDARQVLQVTFGNVDGQIHHIIDQIDGVGYFTPVDVVYRKYYSADDNGPAVPPLYFFASDLVFEGPTTVTFSAEDVDLAQKRAGELYTVEKFPGLED